MAQSTVEFRRDATEEELAARAEEMRGEWAELSKMDRESADYRAAKEAFLAEVEDIDVNLSLRNMARLPATLNQAQRAVGATNGVGTLAIGERRTAGELAVADEDFLKWCKRSAGKTGIGESPTVEMRSFFSGPELRAVVAEGDANGSSGLLPVGQPFLVDTRRRRLFIRDLIGVQQTGLAAIPYIRELNPVANALSASTVAEQGDKPEATVQFTPDLAPVQVIATTIPITTQILEDATTLVGYINGRLIYMLEYREEDEVLRGNGVNPDLKGIMTYSGIQTQSTAGAGEYAITIGNAIAKIELVDGYADGVAMNPATFWAMVTHRAAGGSNASGGGVFDAGMFTQAPIQYVWGLPIVRTNAMNANQNLVGNFAMGATLFDRSQSGVRVFEQHSDYAKKNMVLLRAEERIALAVNRPDFFCVATTS
jgi:HK97 family phage major capsid protein